MVMDLADEQLVAGTKDLYDNLIKQRKNMIQGGVKAIIPVGDQAKAWMDAFEPLEAAWLADCKKKGLGDVARRVLDRYRELAAEAAK